MSRHLATACETWPIAGSFTIARGSRTEARVVVATISDGTHSGRGECVPYSRYGESVEGVMADIEAVASEISAGMSRDALQQSLPPGAARNAVDCAMWDLAAKQSGRRAYELAGLAAPLPMITAFTISLGTPDAMAAKAREAAHRPLLKIKLGDPAQDAERLARIREAVPQARLVVDANEGWRGEVLQHLVDAAARANVEMIEQPLPAGDDNALAHIDRKVPIYADESAHDCARLDHVAARYDGINIKLDKTGGLTEALKLATASRAAGLNIMVGCMIGTSLAMAPAVLLGAGAAYVDLDAPLLLARDREGGIAYDGSLLLPYAAELWG